MYKSKNKPDRIILFEIGVIAALLFVNYFLDIAYTSTFLLENEIEQEYDSAFVLIPYVEPIHHEDKLKQKVIEQKSMLFDPSAFIKQVDHLISEPIIELPSIFSNLPNSIPQLVVNSIPEPTNNIVTFASKKPQFPGGERALAEFIQDNFNITSSMFDYANVILIDVEYVINKDGQISDIKVLRCSHPGLGAEYEAKQMLLKMPNWEPAENDGHPVSIRIIQPIKIQIY